MRGVVLPLTAQQIVTRARYLAGELSADALDSFVIERSAARCPTFFYLLTDHNGGKDPTASDPAERWSSPKELARYAAEKVAAKNGGPAPRPPFVNRTCDCMGGAAWCGGFDRYQPVRFAHVEGYRGAINTNSMISEALGAGRCFRSVGRPEPGSFIVCKSGSINHAIGHIGVVIGYGLAEWEPRDSTCWSAIEVVDVASRHDASGTPVRAHRRTTGRGWGGTGALFIRSIMTTEGK